MIYGAEAPDIKNINPSVIRDVNLSEVHFEQPEILVDILNYWGEGDPITFIEDIKQRINCVFYDEGYKVMAFELFKAFAVGESSDPDWEDPFHKQVLPAARASLDRLPDLMQYGYETGQHFNDFDLLISFTAALGHDYLSSSDDDTSALGNIGAISMKLRMMGFGDGFTRSVIGLIKQTDYHARDNNWIHWESSKADEVYFGEVVTAASENEPLINIADSQQTTAKHLLMQAHVVLSDFFGIFTTENYLQITNDKYPNEISPPMRMIELVDTLLDLTGCDGVSTNGVCSKLLNQYSRIRQRRMELSSVDVT